MIYEQVYDSVVSRTRVSDDSDLGVFAGLDISHFTT